MTDRRVDSTLDAYASAHAMQLTAEGNAFFAELHLRRAAKYLRVCIAPDPAVAAAIETLLSEIDELFREVRPHPDEALAEDTTTSTLLGETTSPHGSSRGTEQGGTSGEAT